MGRKALSSGPLMSKLPFRCSGRRGQNQRTAFRLADPQGERAIRLSLLLLALVGVLAGCGRGKGIEAESSRPTAPGRVPVVLVPGVSREVAGVLRGGTLVPLSGLALRTDAEALTNVGDPRCPADGTSAMEAQATLDRALRGTDVRGLQELIDHLIREEGYVRGNPDQPRDKDYSENPPADRKERTQAASLFVVYYDWRRD